MKFDRHYLLPISLALCLSILFSGWSRAADVPPAGLTVMPGLGALQWNIDNDGASDFTAYTGTCKSNPGLTINDAIDANGDIDAYDTAYTIYWTACPSLPRTRPT